jgi:hypothetical protein
MRRGARLLCIVKEGRLAAYGWIQKWDPFPRRFRWLAPRGTILGYFWTAREDRGQGLYGLLLDHCLAMAPDLGLPVIVYAVPQNKSSIRGLEKAGFARLGKYELTCRFFGLICSHRTLSQERTIAQAMSGR